MWTLQNGARARHRKRGQISVLQFFPPSLALYTGWTVIIWAPTQCHECLKALSKMLGKEKLPGEGCSFKIAIYQTMQGKKKWRCLIHIESKAFAKLLLSRKYWNQSNHRALGTETMGCGGCKFTGSIFNQVTRGTAPGKGQESHPDSHLQTF